MTKILERAVDCFDPWEATAFTHTERPLVLGIGGMGQAGKSTLVDEIGIFWSQTPPASPVA